LNLKLPPLRSVSHDEEWTAWAEEEGVEVEVEGLVEGEAAGLSQRRIQREPNLPTVSWWCLRRGWREGLGEGERWPRRRTMMAADGCVFVG